jgi:hypothetical protein
MAEAVKPSKPTKMADKPGPVEGTRPQKPDEAAYKASLALAEKEHAEAQKKFVSWTTSTTL